MIESFSANELFILRLIVIINNNRHLCSYTADLGPGKPKEGSRWLLL